jgi:hypothetical protein
VPVARYGPPDDPTEYIPQGEPPEEAVPWYRKPAALVAFGALGAVLVALIVWGLASLISGPSSEETPPTLTPITPRSPPRTITETITPTTTAPPVTTTTTTTTEPTTTTTTTTTTEPTTSVSTSISTSTVTETITVPPGG